MNDYRWCALMLHDGLQLTEAEIAEGWHFCAEWDGLLVGPEMPEMESCLCHETKKNGSGKRGLNFE